jgi:hypothetical protein
MSHRPDDWAMVAHELGGALTPVRNAVDLLSGGAVGPGTPDAGRLLAVAARGLARADRILGNLVTLAVPGAQATRAESVDATALLAKLRDDFAGEAAAGQIELVTEGDAGTLLSADPGCLEQLLANLIANAIKFTPAGGRVTFRALRAAMLPGRLALLGGGLGDQPRFTAIEVQDTGMGIVGEARARLFEPFYRAPEALASAIPGSGLGLAVARRLADALHADLQLVAERTPGACFRLVVAADAETSALVRRTDAVLSELASRLAERRETLVVLQRTAGLAPQEVEAFESSLRNSLGDPRAAALPISDTTWIACAPCSVRAFIASIAAALGADPEWSAGLRLHAQRAPRGAAADERLLQGIVRCVHPLPVARSSRTEEVADASHSSRR